MIHTGYNRYYAQRQAYEAALWQAQAEAARKNRNRKVAGAVAATVLATCLGVKGCASGKQPSLTALPKSSVAEQAAAGKPAVATKQKSAAASLAALLPKSEVFPVSTAAHPVITRCIIPGKHYGIDIAAPYGTPVVAATDGLVNTDVDPNAGYGPNYVIIQYSPTFRTGYGHMAMRFVHTGQHVKAGQQIGIVGSMGESTGPHLHFNEMDGLNPDKYNSNVDPFRRMNVPESVTAPAGC